MGYNGVPMGNMSNQQLMQMQLHGMDLQRINAGYPGDRDDCLLASACVRACVSVCLSVLVVREESYECL